MNPGEILALVSAIAVLLIAAYTAFGRRVVPVRAVHVAPIEEGSFFDRLQAHVGNIDTDIIDHDLLRGAVPEWDTSHVPGLEDALHDFEPEGSGWRVVRRLIADVHARQVTGWKEVEGTLASVDVRTGLNALLADLKRDDVSATVAELFWTVARRSRRPNAIKWSLAIASVGLASSELPDLLLFARHSEFTLYACNALLRESVLHPEYRFELIELLGRTTGVGRIQVINAILGDEVLSASPRAQRAVLVNVIDDGQGVSPTLAMAIARRIDIDAWLPTAGEDPRLARGLDRIVEQLLILHEELDGLLGEERIIPFMRRLTELSATRPASFESLSLLRLVRLVLSSKEEEWEVPQDLLRSAESHYRERLDPALVEAALHDEHYRWHALAIISEESMLELLPAVHDDFVRDPNVIGVDILGRLGGRHELETMYRWLVGGLDLRARRSLLTGGTMTAATNEHAGGVAAYALQFMGRLSSPDAIDLVARALVDFDPAIRGAALRALVDVEPWRVDNRLLRAVELALDDPFQRIRHAAAGILELLGDPPEQGWQTCGPGLN